jgi:hypothetical protein
MSIGIFIGVVVLFVVVNAVDEGLLHNPACGLIPGIVLAIWAAWPFFHYEKTGRHGAMHPTKEYRVSSERAFNVIYNILSEGTYNYGNRWSIISANWQKGRILAELQLVDERIKIDVSSKNGLPYVRTKSLAAPPRIRIEAQVFDSADKTTIVKIDLYPEISTHEYSSVIHSVTSAIEAQLGAASKVISTSFPIPPLWLLAITFAMLVYLLESVVSSLPS